MTPVFATLSRRPWTRVLSGTIGVVAGLMGTPASIQAGRSFVPCTHPFVFENASVNVVVLPYTVPVGGPTITLSKPAQELSLLVQLTTLFKIARYGSVGAVHLQFDPNADEPCTADSILRQLTGARQGAEEDLKSGHGLVLLSGSIYEEGSEIAVQTFIRFLRRDRRETAALQIAGQVFECPIAAQTIAFPPRALTHAGLADIRRAFSQATRVHDAPNATSPSHSLEELDQGYWLSEQRDGWMKITPQLSGRAGWINTQVALEGTPLADALPELHFVDLLVGYLRDRLVHEDRRRPSATAIAWCRESLDQFRVHTGERHASAPLAVGEQLLGIMTLQRTQDSSAMTEAMALFESAAARIPENLRAQHLVELSHISRTLTDSTAIRSTEIEALLMRAAAARPDDESAVKNLDHFYQVLDHDTTVRQFDGFEISPGELEVKLRRIKTIKVDG